MGYSVDGKSSQTGLDGGNTNVGVSTGAKYSPGLSSVAVVAIVAVIAFALIVANKGK